MKKIIVTALVTALLVVGGIFVGLFSLLGANEANVAQVGRLVTTMLFIENKYVDEVPLEKLVDGAIDGMTRALGDKHSIYMDNEKFRQLMQQRIMWGLQPVARMAAPISVPKNR